jgi:hypothetical protein
LLDMHVTMNSFQPVQTLLDDLTMNSVTTPMTPHNTAGPA